MMGVLLFRLPNGHFPFLRPMAIALGSKLLPAALDASEWRLSRGIKRTTPGSGCR